MQEFYTREQYAAVELLRGNMVRHNLIVYRDDCPSSGDVPRFDSDEWLAYVPIRLLGTINVQKRLPPGAVAVLINQGHSDPDLVLAVDASEMRLVEAINGRRTIDEIIHRISRSDPSNLQPLQDRARSLFERLWWYDQVVFDTTRKGGKG